MVDQPPRQSIVRRRPVALRAAAASSFQQPRRVVGGACKRRMRPDATGLAGWPIAQVLRVEPPGKLALCAGRGVAGGAGRLVRGRRAVGRRDVLRCELSGGAGVGDDDRRQRRPLPGCVRLRSRSWDSSGPYRAAHWRIRSSAWHWPSPACSCSARRSEWRWKWRVLWLGLFVSISGFARWSIAIAAARRW